MKFGQIAGASAGQTENFLDNEARVALKICDMNIKNEIAISLSYWDRQKDETIRTDFLRSSKVKTEGGSG